MATKLLLARTNAEAHIYMDLHPCQCGDNKFERNSSVIEAEGDLASRYEGACLGCGRTREFIFALPDDVTLPPPGTVVFGDGSPSELLDPGEWLWVADRYASATPGSGILGTDEARVARQQVVTAEAAMGEVLAFVPSGADMVPFEALRTERGRSVYDAEPGRFYQDRLEVVRDTYRQLIADLDDMPS